MLTGEHLVQVTQLLQADGALQEVRQVHTLTMRLDEHDKTELLKMFTDSNYIFLTV